MMTVIRARITDIMNSAIELILRQAPPGNHDPAGARTDFVEKFSGKPA